MSVTYISVICDLVKSCQISMESSFIPFHNDTRCYNNHLFEGSATLLWMRVGLKQNLPNLPLSVLNRTTNPLVSVTSSSLSVTTSSLSVTRNKQDILAILHFIHCPLDSLNKQQSRASVVLSSWDAHFAVCLWHHRFHRTLPSVWRWYQGSLQIMPQLDSGGTPASTCPIAQAFSRLDKRGMLMLGADTKWPLWWSERSWWTTWKHW